ncbi:hypothetical protein POV27_00470 [Aureisphaera galaxeae]|uniref:M61 family metallopeptidase n=1 Tax=Aureisphaera galaxeae TaxID=1538023 RepID=UPI0023501A53|nr:hypothetical protein [Aureisphaera galaxeae]MDC8002510.1 hypothetical protein [Aureisphaera galaxeae]
MKLRFYILLVFICTFSFSVFAFVGLDNTHEILTYDTYEIFVDKKEPLRVHVSAEVRIKGDTLYMNPNCPNYDYPEGWTSFVKDLTITTLKGKPVSYEYVSKSKWVIEPNREEVLKLDYEVDLSFTKIRWDVGNEQAGFTDGKSVYTVSKALFIYSNMDSASMVSFNLPSQWNLAVPWNLMKDRNEYTFYVANRETLLENSLVYGDFHLEKIQHGAFQFTLALLGDARKDSELFNSILSKITRAYLKIFDKTPTSNYLVTMFYAALNDGESFNTSLTFTLKDPINEHNKIIWANQMAHELFHYWNSDLIIAENRTDRQWFSEGTAEYYANMTLIREGIIPESIFQNKVEKVLGLYQNYRGWREGKTSLLEAGKNKGVHRFLVYNGGWAVAMALDIEIIENSKGQKNLDDFMRSMFDKFSTTPYTYQDLVETASIVAGTDLTDFFAKYVEGTELLPLNEYLGKLGYTMLDIIYEAEMYLVKKSDDQLGLHDTWLRKKP